MRITLLLLCAVALLLPSASHADDGERTVRLVIECSPKTAEAIQHLLEGLPARVFRADPVGSPAPKPAVERKPRPGVVSVLPTWEAIEDVVKSEDFGWLQVDQVRITARSARITVVAKDEPTFGKLRKALLASPVLQRRCAGPHFVEMGALFRSKGRVRGGLTLKLRPMPNAPGAEVDVPGVDLTKVNPLHVAAKVTPFRIGAERRDKQANVTRIWREWVFEETHLDNLRAFVRAADKAAGMVPTELRWQLRDESKRADGSPLIQKSTVRLAGWLKDAPTAR